MDEELKYPEWQKAVQDLFVEVDRERLREKIRAVETLIIKRHQEIARASDGLSEREALNAATLAIQVLKQSTARPKPE